MRALLRRVGLGRLVLNCVHRPAGTLWKSWQAGGPVQQYLTRKGQLAMETAAIELPALPFPDPAAPSIHLLTGAGLWCQTAFFLHSLSRFLPVKPVIHSDGTLVGNPLARLRRIIPFAEFVPPDETEARLDKFLPGERYPALRGRRREQVLFRKLLDIHAGRQGWSLFMDSDMLVFREPAFLRQWLATADCACHMVDVSCAYGYPLDLLERIAGRSVPDLVNTGLLGLRSDAIDWDQMEHWCAILNTSPRPSYYQEQALAALWLSQVNHAPVPREDYVVFPRPPEAQACSAVIHHYVAGSKRWYFQNNWKRFLRTSVP